MFDKKLRENAAFKDAVRVLRAIPKDTPTLTSAVLVGYDHVKAILAVIDAPQLSLPSASSITSARAMLLTQISNMKAVLQARLERSDRDFASSIKMHQEFTELLAMADFLCEIENRQFAEAEKAKADKEPQRVNPCAEVNFDAYATDPRRRGLRY